MLPCFSALEQIYFIVFTNMNVLNLMKIDDDDFPTSGKLNPVVLRFDLWQRRSIVVIFPFLNLRRVSFT